MFLAFLWVLAVTDSIVATTAMPRAAAVAIVVHTTISAEVQAPFHILRLRSHIQKCQLPTCSTTQKPGLHRTSTHSVKSFHHTSLICTNKNLTAEGEKIASRKSFPVTSFSAYRKNGSFKPCFDKCNPGTWMKVVPYHFPLRPEVLMPGSNLDSNNKKSPLGPARIF